MTPVHRTSATVE